MSDIPPRSPARDARRRRARRASWGALAALALGLLSLLLGAVPAHAAGDDVIDSMTAKFVVDKAGVTHVTETVVYRFGPSSGRHGLTWSILTREKYDSAHDQVYGLSNITVTSPTAATDIAQSSVPSAGGHTVWTTLRIGSQYRTVTTPTATYTISYDVTGALRHFDGYDEFYWDVLSDNTPTVTKLVTTVSVPGGVRETSCFTGPVQGKGSCASSAVTQGVATYTVANKQPSDFVTVGAKIASGQVSNPNPTLVDPAGKRARQFGLVATPFAVVLPLLIGWVAKRAARDERFVGLPPGVTPAPGENANVAPSGAIEIPVQFSPPKVPLADAGLLLGRTPGATEMAATLVSLATRGAVQMSGDDSQAWVRLVDPERATTVQERIVLDAVFDPSGGSGAGASDLRTLVGSEASLGTAGQIYLGQGRLRGAVYKDAEQNRWFNRLPGLAPNWPKAVGILAIVALGFWLFSTNLRTIMANGTWWYMLPLAALALVTVLVGQRVRRAQVNGSRTATGRALTDQVEGFRTYIATAEAEQLRFEEGEDIYSRYLPWAILFGLADRWARVCARLVELGRLSQQPPTWYVGDPYLWNFYWFNGQVGRVTTSAGAPPPPPPTVSSSGSGFGGGSSFGGGGFSGGGGGGTSIGSW